MTETSAQLDEIWNQEIAYWGTIRSGDLDGYLSIWHEDVLGWPNSYPTPMNRDEIHHEAANVLATIQSESIKVKLKPQSVQAYGDIGIVYYELDFTAVTKKGEDITMHNRLTHTWLRTENGWKIIGGMSAPLS